MAKSRLALRAGHQAWDRVGMKRASCCWRLRIAEAPGRSMKCAMVTLGSMFHSLRLLGGKTKGPSTEGHRGHFIQRGGASYFCQSLSLPAISWAKRISVCFVRALQPLCTGLSRSLPLLATHISLDMEINILTPTRRHPGTPVSTTNPRRFDFFQMKCGEVER